MAEGTRMQQRRATEAVWATSGYVLADGELGVTTDTGIIKIGDGVNAWSDLDPAFGSSYLPILGTAANSSLLGGISSSGFWQTADATTAATASKLALRTGTGTVKGAVAAASDDLVAKSQLDTTNANVTTNTTDIDNLKIHSAANRTALLAISTGSLPYGYLVKQTDKGYIWMWDGAGWRYKGNPTGDNPYIELSRGTLSWGNLATAVWGFSLLATNDTDLFTWSAGTSSSVGGYVSVTEAGRYHMMGLSQTTYNPSAYYTNVQMEYPSIPNTYKLFNANGLMGAGTPSGFMDFTVHDFGALPASQHIRLQVYINIAGSELRGALLHVERLPSI
jgi:hypothetical protein